jgi:hypothetical protein
MTPLEQLQAAGFSDAEIGQWATTQRTTLRAAGFAEDEIDGYLQGPKEPVPAAYLDRVRRGTALGRVLGRIGEGVKFGWGQPEGMSAEAEKFWRGLGVFNDPEKGQASPIRTMNEAMIRPFSAGWNVMEAAFGAGVTGIGALAGGIAEEFGADEGSAGRLARDVRMWTEMALTAPGLQVPVARPHRMPTGEVRDVPIGNLPEAGDFAAASRVVAGTPTPHPGILDKIRRLWREHGIHPAEVAYDAESNPTIAQDLASSTSDLPRAYAGEGRPQTLSPEQITQQTGDRQRSPTEAAGAIEGVPATRVADTPETAPVASRDATFSSDPAPRPAQIREFAPGELRVDAQRFQFKGGADAAGVTERLQGVTQWDPIKAGLSIVFEDRQGAFWIADGHQRRALAERIAQADPAQDPRLNAWVLREADGIRDIDARAIAAARNIAEGTGSAVDAAKVLRDRPDLLPSLPPRSELVRQARALMNLSDEAFGMIVNDVIPPNYGAIVGRLAPADARMQSALIDLINKTGPDNAVQAEAIIRQGIEAGTRTETQATLFGDVDVVQSLYLERARILDRAMKQLRRDRRVFEALVDNQRIIEELGNQLARDENARRAAVDGHAAQILQTLANRKGPLSDALTAAARDLADRRAGIAAVSRDFVDAIRRQAESGALARGADGGSGSPVAVAGEGGAAPAATAAGRRGTEQPAIPREEYPRDISPAQEARATEQAAEAIRPPEQRTPVIEQTDQGAQLVIPGAERSARQAAQAREDAGRGMATTDVPQREPGGLFETPKAPEPDLFFQPRPDTPPVGMGLGAPPPVRTPAERAILDHINVGGRTDRRPWSWDRLYTAIWDQLHPIEIATREAVGGRAAADALPTLENPYRMARLLAGNAGRARHWLEFGQVDFKTGETIGPGLKEILAPVRQDLDPFRSFAVAVRALELDRRGIETGVNLSAARADAAAKVDKFGPILAEVIRYHDNLAAYLRDAGVLSREGYEAMREANRLYIPFHRVIGDEPGGAAGGGGSIQPGNPIHRIKGSERQIVDPVESIIRNTYLYVTMAERNQAATALVDLLRANQPLRPPPGRTTTATPAARIPEPQGAGWSRQFQEAAQRPDLFPDRGPVPREEPVPIRPVPETTEASVAQAIRELLGEHGLGDELFDFMASAVPPKAGEIRVFRQGKAETWEVGRDVAAAVKALDKESANTIIRLLAMPARMLRAGATLSPDFMVRNPVRDFFSAFVQTGKTVFHPVDTAKGLYSAIVKDQHFRDWLKAGGGNAELVAMDRRYLQESLRGLTQDTGLSTRAWNVVRHPLDILRTVSELSEQMTRLGEFRAVRERALREGETPREAAARAAFSSREVSVDFSRHGAITQSLNMMTAFWNAQLQGADRTIRAIRDNPGGTALKIAAGITLPSVLLWYANHDDPRWRELPDWQRDLFWIVMTENHIYRIPKPFELGVIFGSGIERLLDKFVADNPDALDGFVKAIAGAVVPAPVPTAAVPVIEQWGNRSTFADRSLIPAWLEKQLPEYQYNPYTTETAKALGQVVAAFPGMRELAISDQPAAGVARAMTTPILIENYLRGWTGGRGMYALHVADAALRAQGLLPDPPKPEDTLADIPVVKAFVVRYPSASAASIQRFHDEYERNRQYFTSWQSKAEDGDLEAVRRIQEAGGPRLFVQLDAVRRTLGEHAKLIRDIWKNPEIAPEEKRQLIDSLYFSQIQIAQGALETLRQADRALSTEGSR